MIVDYTDENVRQIILDYLVVNKKDFSFLLRSNYNWIYRLNLDKYFKQYKSIEEGLVKALPELKDENIQNEIIDNVSLANVRGIFKLLVYINNIDVKEMNLLSLKCLKIQKIANKIFNRSRLKTLGYCIGENKFNDNYVVYKELYCLINSWVGRLLQHVRNDINYIRDIRAYKLKSFDWYKYLDTELGGFKNVKSYILKNYKLFGLDEYGKINKDKLIIDDINVVKTINIKCSNDSIDLGDVSEFSNSELLEIADAILKTVRKCKL